MSISIIINNKDKTAKYGYLDTKKYQTEGDYIYWTNLKISEGLTEPMLFFFYLNTKTGVFKSGGNGNLSYTRNCFSSLDT